MLQQPAPIGGMPAELVPWAVRRRAGGQGPEFPVLLAVEKHPRGCHELETVPLYGIVTRGHGNSSRRVCLLHRKLDRGGRTDADVQDVDPFGSKGRRGNVCHNPPRDASVASDDDRWTS